MAKQVLTEPVDRRERVIAAARELFTSRGYEQTTIAEVARHAGVAVGTVYHYFDGKHDVLVELSIAAGKEIAAAIFSPSILARPYTEQARAMVDAIFHVCQTMQDEIGLLHLNFDSQAETRRWGEFGNQVIGALAGYLDDGMQKGVFHRMPAEMTARLLYGMVDSALNQCFVIENGARPHEYKDGLVAIFERVLFAGSEEGR